MKKIHSIILALFVMISSVVTADAQSRIDGLKAFTGNTALDALQEKLRAKPTYGGEWKLVTNNKRRASSHGATTEGGFKIQLGKLQLNDKNLDQYLIPVTIQPGADDPITSVKLWISKAERSVVVPLQSSGEFIADKSIVGFLPLRGQDVGIVRVGIEVATEKGGTSIEEYDYDVPNCRVPDLIGFPNPPHDTRFVKHVSQVHGLPRNLMLGGAFYVRAISKEILEKFDPNQPQNMWGPVTVVNAPTYFNNGYLETHAYYWPGMSQYGMHVVPGICGRFAKGDIQPFYTDEDNRRRIASIDLQITTPVKGEWLKVRATLQNARSAGYLYGIAVGYNQSLDWWHEHWDLPARVEASEDPQVRLFEFYTLIGFTYGLRFQYFGFNDQGYLELLIDEETPRTIPGTTEPCWFCG